MAILTQTYIIQVCWLKVSQSYGLLSFLALKDQNIHADADAIVSTNGTDNHECYISARNTKEILKPTILNEKHQLLIEDGLYFQFQR